ncbi:MAG TPA: SDR family NAD(P)-dependent oxidoreductase [Solirubrobacteraceae bacterium]|nr:SDR family NAD(P)-dependent oxidoreductase [Solirubrobacteraceae bacterium]
MDTEDLTGRTAVVTGAASGIGRAIALLAAERGAGLALCDIDEAGLAAVAGEVRRLGRDVLTEPVDVADRDQMRAFAAKVHDGPGPADLLVNNAGVGLVAGFLETTLEDWDWIVGTNLLGVVHGCHFFVPQMVERGSGHVVNLSSLAGYHANPALAAYSATKFAVLGLSEALHDELVGTGVGVTAVCPGIVNTPITRNARARGAADDPAVRERYVRLYQRRGYGPDKVARNVLKAVARDRTVAPVSPESWVAYGVKRTSPRLASWLARQLASTAR